MQLRRWIALPAVVAIILATVATVPSVMAAGRTLRLDLATQTVDKGATFTVKVIANADIILSGVQATVTFDKAKVSITEAAKGADWAAAPLWVPGDLSAEVAKANTKGKLATVFASYFPPGNTPAGDSDFLDITFKALACGQVTLGLPAGPADGLMLDGRAAPNYGKTINVTTTGAKITIGGSSCTSTPPPSTSAAPTPSPAGGSPTPSPAGESPSASPSPSAESPSPETSPTPVASPSESPSPSAAATPAPSASSEPGATSPASDTGSPPWLLVGVVLVVVAGATAFLLRGRLFSTNPPR